MALAVVVTTMAGDKPYRISGVTLNADKKPQATGILEQAHGGVVFQMEYLDPQAAREVVIKTLGREIDMLPGRGGEGMPGYLVFLVQVANNSKEDVVFNPNMARMATSRGDYKIALDYSAMYEIGSHLGSDPPSSDEIAAMVFDQEVTLKPGGSARKLLVFEGPHEDLYKSMEVKLAEVNIGAKATDFVFPFRKFFDGTDSRR